MRMNSCTAKFIKVVSTACQFWFCSF